MVVFFTIIPQILALLTIAFFISGDLYNWTGWRIFQWIAKLFDKFDVYGETAPGNWPYWGLLIFVILVAIYCYIAGWVHVKGWSCHYETDYTEYKIDSDSSGRVRVEKMEKSEEPFWLWDYVLLPIIAIVLIVVFGWLVCIIQTIRKADYDLDYLFD